MNCVECEQPATVYHGSVPLCGTCFYKRALGQTNSPSEPVNHEVWQRLSTAVATLEALVSKIAGEVDELTKRRKD